MRKSGIATGFLIVAIALSPRLVAAQTQETDIVGVTATLAFARQYDGVLHVGISLKNTTKAETAAGKTLAYSEVVLIDSKAKKKYFALKDTANHYLAGPISDLNGGGRWFVKLPPESDTLLWVLFDALPPGSVVALQAPLLQPIDKVAVTEGPPGRLEQVGSSLPGLRANVVSAARAEGQLKVRVRIAHVGKIRAAGHYVNYEDVYLLDPQGKRKYLLLKGDDGLYVAQPMSDKANGGRWFPSKVDPGGQAFLDFTFPAPPDTVKSVDVVIPWFGPLEATAIAGEGGGKGAGVAVTGKSEALGRALQDLNADVTSQQIKVSLSADLLFDFDKADLKKDAEPSLEKVATVLRSYPQSQITIDGHADGKGSDAYNQPLSEKRAAAVAQWLIAHIGLSAANVHTKGWGKSKPIAPNTKSDGSDDPEGRAKNRRVEITVNKS